MIEMAALDCESRKSTLESLAAIYKVDEQMIDDFLRSIDIDKHYAQSDPPHTADKEVLRLFEDAFSTPKILPTRVYWFHLTRVPPNSDFKDGIKPLTEALDKVWDTILQVFKGSTHEEGLNALRSREPTNGRYGRKLSSLVHCGPFAMLVRESASRSQEMGNHDYLSLPEIMDDICDAYHTTYRVRIEKHLRDSLVPCIVKFWSQERMEGTMSAAMYYLYCIAHRRRLTTDANICYDGCNERVPYEQVVKVQFANI